MMADHDVTKMKVADLKRELKNRALSTAGNKNELQDRLQAALLEGGPLLEDTGISEDLLDDDVLNDEEEEDLEEVEKALLDATHEEEHILKSPSPEEKLKPISPVPQHKKVLLKRYNNPIAITAILPSTEPAASVEKDEEENLEEPDKKVIKLTMTEQQQQRLELRAKKFGTVTNTPIVTSSATPVVSDTKKEARAARFGLGSTNSIIDSKKTDLSSVEALKKRAERFGVACSDKLTKIELDERLQKRKERFGGAAKTVVADAPTTGEISEKARLRLERFKN